MQELNHFIFNTSGLYVFGENTTEYWPLLAVDSPFKRMPDPAMAKPYDINQTLGGMKPNG